MPRTPDPSDGTAKHRAARWTVALLLPVALGGCAAQQTLSTAEPYSKVYGAVLPFVKQSLAAADEAARRDAVTAALGLSPSADAGARARELACRTRDAAALSAHGIAQNLEAFNTAVTSLATASGDSLTALAKGLTRGLPDPSRVIADGDSLGEVETRRMEACNRFADAALSQAVLKSFGPQKQVTAAIDALREVLAYIEKERRARAYADLVIALDGRIEANLVEIENALATQLLQTARRSLLDVALAVDESRSPGASAAASARIDAAAAALGRFDRAQTLYQGLYRPTAGEEASVFRMLVATHKQIVARARSSTPGVRGVELTELSALTTALRLLQSELDRI